MIRFISLFAWIFVVVVQGTNYKTWMADNAPLLSQKTLGNISLVATHDSGTYNLTNTLINLDSYGPPLTTLYNALDTIANWTGEPLSDLIGLFADGVRAASKCTTKDIYSQLCDGNRGLDLRLSVYNGNIYMAHVLQGPSLSIVLAEVMQFLNETTGEVVYITAGHPYGFNQTYIDLLDSLLNPFVKGGFAITPAAYPGNLLTYTYGQLVNNSRSRVIIVLDDTINPNNNSYFSASTYSPPDGGSNTLCGFYTDSDNITVVITNQTANYIHCGTIPAPAAIYMTLTPSTGDTADLANELILEVFDNLDTYQIYESFFHLNIRFQNLCTHANLSTQVGMSSVSKTTFQRYYDDLIAPNKHRIQSLHLSNPFISDFFISLLEDIKRCSQLQTLTLCNIEYDCLETVLTAAVYLPNLSSLSICVNSQSDKITIYKLIFQLPVLKYCKMTFQDQGRDFLKLLSMSINSSSLIERLVISDNYDYSDIDTILSYVPRIRYLSVRSQNLLVMRDILGCLVIFSDLTHMSIITNCLSPISTEEFVKKHSHQVGTRHARKLGKILFYRIYHI
ncbi:unnamed protein product [Adineta steineri]|uniref:Uncharacterized protein n=1 Tax=Adineta steineri TaxID=433720 RepID=A0A819KWR9_9BILA|nr:unnamed protein product [Adineta steineri]CAF3951745.1 unnamed protein product [Adineta steineri]